MVLLFQTHLSEQYWPIWGYCMILYLEIIKSLFHYAFFFYFVLEQSVLVCVVLSALYEPVCSASLDPYFIGCNSELSFDHRSHSPKKVKRYLTARHSPTSLQLRHFLFQFYTFTHQLLAQASL